MEPSLIREMTITDIDSVLDIETANFKTPWRREHFIHELLFSPISRLLVIEINRNIAGYVGLWILPDEMHITNIAIHPDWKRKGLAQKLLDRSIDIALKNHLESLTLEVRAGNSAAMALYLNNGFKQVGRRPKYYEAEGEDALILTRNM